MQHDLELTITSDDEPTAITCVVWWDSSQGSAEDDARRFVDLESCEVLAVAMRSEATGLGFDWTPDNTQEALEMFTRLWKQEWFQRQVCDAVAEDMDDLGAFAGWDDIAAQERLTRAEAGI